MLFVLVSMQGLMINTVQYQWNLYQNIRYSGICSVPELILPLARLLWDVVEHDDKVCV